MNKPREEKIRELGRAILLESVTPKLKMSKVFIDELSDWKPNKKQTEYLNKLSKSWVHFNLKARIK